MEKWKDIEGYFGDYEISNLGRVISNKTGKPKIMKQHINQGLMRISLANNRIKKHHYIHRLVAEAFIPNPNGFRKVNHIDGNYKNNNVDNLKWFEYNDFLHKQTKKYKSKNTPIGIYTMKNKKLGTFKSVSDAVNHLNSKGIKATANGIRQALYGNIQSAFKYKWKWEE